jgi:hypothetical protein
MVNMTLSIGLQIVHLYVQVSFETALERNSRRKRRVPDEIIRKYIEELPDAVHSVMEEDGLVDEFIQFNNNREDERTEHERWGQYFRVIQENSSKRETFIDFHVRKDVQQTVRELFDALDTDNDGIISVDELRKVMTEATGTVDAEEIIRAAEIIREGSPDRQLRYQDFVLLVLHDHVNCKLARICAPALPPSIGRFSIRPPDGSLRACICWLCVCRLQCTIISITST